MEKGPSDLERRQGMVERLRSELVGIEPLHGLARVFIGRHHATSDERVEQIGAALQVAVAAAALSARDAALDGERLLVLRIAPVGKDAAAHVEDSAGIVVFVKADSSPADGVRSEIQAQSVLQVHSEGRVHIASHRD